MYSISTASGNQYAKFKSYVDLKGLAHSELDFLELCMRYIVTVELMRANSNIKITDLILNSCDTGYSMILGNYVKLNENIKQEVLKKRYTEALAGMMDYARVKDNTNESLWKFNCLNEAFELHKKHLEEGSEKDTSSFYNQVLLLGGLTELYIDESVREFTFRFSEKYITILKQLHKMFYLLFTKSNFVKECKVVVLNPFTGFLELLGLNTFSFLLDSTLYMISIDGANTYNGEKWETLINKYKALWAEEVSCEKLVYSDMIDNLALVRLNFGEIELLRTSKDMMEQSYDFIFGNEHMKDIFSSANIEVMSKESYYKMAKGFNK